MKRIAFCLAALSVLALAVNQAQAAPGDVERITTVNLTGGASIGAPGVATVFGPPTIINLPGILQAGEYTFGPLTGTYYYYPASNYTVFSGVFSGGGNSISMSGFVFNDVPGADLGYPLGSPGQVVGTINITGFGLTGTHLATSQ